MSPLMPIVVPASPAASVLLHTLRYCTTRHCVSADPNEVPYKQEMEAELALVPVSRSMQSMLALVLPEMRISSNTAVPAQPRDGHVAMAPVRSTAANDQSRTHHEQGSDHEQQLVSRAAMQPSAQGDN